MTLSPHMTVFSLTLISSELLRRLHRSPSVLSWDIVRMDQNSTTLTRRH